MNNGLEDYKTFNMKLMKQTLSYCALEWEKLFSFIGAGGGKALVLKVLLFFWLWFCNYGTYFLVPLFIGFADCYYDTRANIIQGQKFDFMRFVKGVWDKWFSFGALLLMFFGIEHLVKKDIHYDGNYLLLAITFIISSHEVGGCCSSLTIIHPSWKFVQNISQLLGVAQKKIIDKAENIL